MGLTEGVLQNDVKDLLNNSVLTVEELGVQLSDPLAALVDKDRTSFALVGGLLLDGIFDGLQRENHLARGHEGTKELGHTATFLEEEDLVDEIGIENLIWSHRERILVDEYFFSKVDSELI